MDDDQERTGRLPLLGKEKSWRTAWRGRSLLKRTNRSSAISIARTAPSRQEEQRAGADAYERELLDAFDERQRRTLGRYLDALGGQDAA